MLETVNRVSPIFNKIFRGILLTASFHNSLKYLQYSFTFSAGKLVYRTKAGEATRHAQRPRRYTEKWTIEMVTISSDDCSHIIPVTDMENLFPKSSSFLTQNFAIAWVKGITSMKQRSRTSRSARIKEQDALDRVCRKLLLKSFTPGILDQLSACLWIWLCWVRQIIRYCQVGEDDQEHHESERKQNAKLTMADLGWCKEHVRTVTGTPKKIGAWYWMIYMTGLDIMVWENTWTVDSKTYWFTSMMKTDDEDCPSRCHSVLYLPILFETNKIDYATGIFVNHFLLHISTSDVSFHLIGISWKQKCQSDTDLSHQVDCHCLRFTCISMVYLTYSLSGIAPLLGCEYITFERDVVIEMRSSTAFSPIWDVIIAFLSSFHILHSHSSNLSSLLYQFVPIFCQTH